MWAGVDSCELEINCVVYRGHLQFPLLNFVVNRLACVEKTNIGGTV